MTSKAAIPSSQTDLKDLSWEELEAFLAAHGAERYRARQVAHRLFKIGVTHVSEMTDLPKSLRHGEGCRQRGIKSRCALPRRFCLPGALPLRSASADQGGHAVLD